MNTIATSPRAATPGSTDDRASLARVFWLYGVVVGVAMAVVLAFLGGFAPAASRVVIVLLLVYQVAWYVALWRAAGRYTGPLLWKWAARSVIFLPLIGFVLGFALTARTSVSADPTAASSPTPQAAPYTSPPGFKPFTGKLDGE